MRIAILTSTGLRHAYMTHRLMSEHKLVLAVREKKGLNTFYNDHPDREIIEDHFQSLADAEAGHFSDTPWDDVPAESVTTVERGELNTGAIAELIRDAQPDAMVVFGCGIVKSPILEVIPAGRTFNLHQGLSPYYRGSGTNFWPFVEGRLEYIGVTLHLIDPGIDTGGIIAHARPDIAAEDTLHSIGCKTVMKTADVLCTALQALDAGEKLSPLPQWDDGSLYKRSDLDGDAIRKVREREQSGFVAEFVQRREQGLVTPVQLVRLEK